MMQAICNFQQYPWFSVNLLLDEYFHLELMANSPTYEKKFKNKKFCVKLD